MPIAPQRLLLLRPDAYGDLMLFEPVLRLLREAWPQTEIAVIIRKRYADIVPLLDPDGAVRFIETGCDPYREGPGGNRPALQALREEAVAFAPDCLVAACASQTWLEAAVATYLPGIRQMSLGAGLLEPVSRAALEAELPVNWSAIYPEKVSVEPGQLEWETNLRLASALLGREAPRWWPVAWVGAQARARAGQITAELGLTLGAFAGCAAAGAATVSIKSWPPERYGEAIGWLERKRGIRTLLVGHEAEQVTLDAVREAARIAGGNPSIWTGSDGEYAVLGGLLEAARFYLGNDTGALHLAAALGKPLVGVYGGGTWPRFKPIARRSVTVVQPLPCFGCDWNCYFGNAPCVREIPIEAVTGALDRLLASDENAQTEITVTDAIPPASLALIAGAAARGRNGEMLSTPGLTELFKQLDYSETDRAARMGVIKAQGDELGRLTERAGQLEGERDLTGAQLADLRGHFGKSEADRLERLAVIEAQGAETTRLHAEVARWIEEANGLWPRLNAAENARNLLASQLDNLRAQYDRQHDEFCQSEADRVERLAVIEAQGAETTRLHAEVTRWLQEATDLWPRLNAAENARNLLAAQMDELRGHFAGSEADRAARLEVIENQGVQLARLAAAHQAALAHAGALEQESSERLRQFEALQQRHRKIEQHWSARLLKTLRLWPR